MEGDEPGSPAPEEPSDEPLPTAGSSVPEAKPTPEPRPEKAVLYEQRLISLEWPQKIRVGESDRIQLTLEVDEQGIITPTVSSEGNEIIAEPVQIPDLYEDYYINAEARFDIVGVDIQPTGTVSTALIKGKDLYFAWSISPRQTGEFSGTVWLHLNLTPKDGGVNRQELLFAKPITIEGVSVFGMPAAVARWGGFLGTGISFFLGLPFIENILSWLFGRFKKQPIKKTNNYT